MQNHQGIKKVRLSDVADACGVRASTVSRVLSGVSEGFSVKENVRKLILDTARSMNYVPNAAARHLRSNRTMSIQVLGFHFNWIGSYSQILEVCTDLLNRKGYMVNAVFGNYSRMRFAPMLTDGVVLITAENRELLQKIREAELPFVVVNDRLGDDECWIEYDNAGSVRKNMEYLIGAGCRRIVYSGHFGFFYHTTHPSIRTRREGYRELCRLHGLETFELPDGIPPEDAAKSVRDCHADGVLCYSADNAAELVNLLSVMEIQVPEQVKIAVFDKPPVHTDRIAYTEIDPDLVGRTVAELLLNRIEKGISGHCVFRSDFHRPPS